MSTSIDIECPDCGDVNSIEVDTIDELTKSFWLSLECEACGSPLFDEEDYTDEPPVFVSQPPSKTSAPTFQEPDRHQPEGGKWRIGKDTRTGGYVDAPQAGRREGLYIIGTSGTGKTGLIENLIIQDIKQGMGVGLLDPHGDLTNAVLSRLPDRREKDVIYLDITDYHYPFGVNPFECSDLTNPIEVQKTVDQIMHIFEKLLGVSRDTPLILQYLRNCTYTLIANPGYTMADIPLLLTNKNCRQQLVANVKRLQTRLFWQQYEQMKPSDQLEQIASIQRRVDDFLQDLILPIVGQAKTTVDLRQVMDDGKILLVKLSAQLDSVTSLIGSVFVALILNAAYSRSVNKRRQFNLYADEFQRFATEDFATLLVEARKFGVATTIAHQARYQPGMTDGIRATSLSAKNLIVFKVNSKDADELAGEFDITPPPATIEVRRPQQHRRIEEQVEVEVEEEIMSISQTPLNHLKRGSHKSAKVREAIQALTTYSPSTSTFPEDIHLIYDFYPDEKLLWNYPYKTSLNDLLVDVMEGHLEPGTKDLALRIEKNALFNASYLIWLKPGNFGVLRHTAENYDPLGLAHLSKKDYEQYVGRLRHETEELAVYTCLSALTWGLVSGQGQLDRLKQDMADALTDVFTRRYAYDWYRHCMERKKELAKRIEDLHEEEYFVHSSVFGSSTNLPEFISANSYEFISAKRELDGLLSKTEKKVTHARQLLAEWAPSEVNEIVAYIRHVLTLCEELATEEGKIRVPTGQKRMVKRIQPHITYLTDESEKVITQRSYPEMLKVVSSELANLDNFMARVKYIDANQRRVERTIRTLDPSQSPDKPLFGQALEDRITRIQALNRTPDENGLCYCRSRQEVEEEIKQRQEQCCEPPEKEPPISRRPQL